ncbi:histone-fold-containing protein [Gymnopilus junonius]|uniref:DNA polymerase epsilon subunit D n=1 Tax=Gymnopilus junonius TaxID=109634 RepID=A0A9P5NNF6_GYMJU|nr:histone-fold-containing protein [Gymnopilus junonius]
MPRKDTYSGPISAQAQQELVSEGIENFELPKSVVMKIAKSSIPDNMKLQKETVISLVKGSTVFINYLAATAHDVALSKQHKSISASDVLKALETIEFGDMVNKLHDEVQSASLSYC